MDKVNIEELKRGGVVKLKEKGMFSVWVKTYCANLSAKQLRKVGELSKKYGRGMILFSTRQIPIIPFVKLEDVETVKSELEKVEVGLDHCGPRLRNANVCYEDTVCKEAVTNSLSLGEKLEKNFVAPIFHKTKIGISGCSKDCIGARALNDLCFIGMGKGGLYDAYLGGRLGLKPFVGVKMAESISEDKCVKFADNYFSLLREEGKPKERSADIINRLGENYVKNILIKDLDKIDIIKKECSTHVQNKQFDKIILRVRAACGEVSAEQVRVISDLAQKYGNGFVHFTIYGSPELPGVDKSDIENIRKELKNVNLEILDKGIDNVQSCFGGYCTKGAFDIQSLLKRMDSLVKEIGLNNQDIKISGSGCPNSCGIAHISDIGFLGIVDPVIDEDKCKGCGICEKACKVKAIKIVHPHTKSTDSGGVSNSGVSKNSSESYPPANNGFGVGVNKLAVIDKTKCSYCGECIRICPVNAFKAQRSGIKILAGGSYGKETVLGKVISEFLSEDEAFTVAKNCLKIIKEKKSKVKTIIDEIGIEKFKALVLK